MEEPEFIIELGSFLVANRKNAIMLTQAILGDTLSEEELEETAIEVKHMLKQYPHDKKHAFTKARALLAQQRGQ